MSLNSPNVRRIIGVLVLLAGVALVIISRDTQTLGVVMGVVLMAVGFWLSYIRNEIAKIRRGGNERQ